MRARVGEVRHHDLMRDLHGEAHQQCKLEAKPDRGGTGAGEQRRDDENVHIGKEIREERGHDQRLCFVTPALDET
ncbi:MAG: hypothetical protein ACR2J1_03835 [Methyloceanibacter sp.]|uniref:hypothetical protein n=1 Tax=Methyloceanibacter sp. TaxID=1965321 RepID=UPI003D9BF718